MAFPRKIKAPIAVDKHSQHDLSCNHVTTTNFMQFQIAKTLEVVPGQTVKISHETFARLEAMPVPTFGSARIYNRAYFVPYRTVFPAFNELYYNTPHVFSDGTASIPSNVPFVTDGLIAEAFRNPALSTIATSTQRPDFTTRVSVSVNETRVLTSMGRRAFKLMRTLGYSMIMRVDSVAPASLLPIFSVMRVYLDYYYPAQYANDSDSSWLLSKLNNDIPSQTLNAFSADDLVRVFGIIDNVAYDSDYFTSAWDNTNSPSDGLASTVTIPSIDGPRTTNISYTEDGNAPEIVPNGGSSLKNITQYALNSLHKLSDYMKRHQIAGSRVIDRALARFGFTMSSDKLLRSYKLFEKSDVLHFGDVTATADTEGAPLGAFAGKGVTYTEGGFDFTSKEDFGMLVIVSTIVPVTKYYQGTDRTVRHISAFDFWTPEFDGMGVQAMGRDEVYAPVDGTEAPDDYSNKVFGFVPRYSEYKRGRDMLTGDYILNSMNTGKSSWTLYRDLKPYVDSVGINNFVHDFNFMIGSDANQYNRIFYNVDDSADHINVWHKFDIKSNFPGRSLWDTYEFENEGEARNVTLNVNGATDN